MPGLGVLEAQIFRQVTSRSTCPLRDAGGVRSKCSLVSSVCSIFTRTRPNRFGLTSKSRRFSSIGTRLVLATSATYDEISFYARGRCTARSARIINISIVGGERRAHPSFGSRARFRITACSVS